MALIIRPTTTADLPAIEALYGGRKVGPELAWLFTNPDNISELNSFVATEGDVVVGVVGYAPAPYTLKGQSIQGITPMSWKIADGYKGFAGVQLLKKVYSLGGFGLAIGGSKAAKDMYPLYKLKYQTEVRTFIKIFNPLKHFLSLQNSLPRKAANTLLLFKSWLKYTPKGGQTIRLQKIDAETYMPSQNEDVFQKAISPAYLRWLLACPTANTAAYSIANEGKSIGLAVIYYQAFGMGIKRGRIVYLSHLGDNQSVWQATIRQLHHQLKKAGCGSVSAIGLNPQVCKAFDMAGYTHFKRKDKALYLKDKDKYLEGITIADWHIQYTEGDKAYRSI